MAVIASPAVVTATVDNYAIFSTLKVLAAPQTSGGGGPSTPYPYLQLRDDGQVLAGNTLATGAKWIAVDSA